MNSHSKIGAAALALLVGFVASACSGTSTTGTDAGADASTVIDGGGSDGGAGDGGGGDGGAGDGGVGDLGSFGMDCSLDVFRDFPFTVRTGEVFRFDATWRTNGMGPAGDSLPEALILDPSNQENHPHWVVMKWAKVSRVVPWPLHAGASNTPAGSFSSESSSRFVAHEL